LSELSKTLRTPGSSSSSTVASEDSNIPTTSPPEFKQIMKRLPGKSARDAEDDAKSESSQSQVLTHEERQAMYEKTRARIFSDYIENQTVEPIEKGTSDDAGSESN
jgi:SUZ domain